MTVAFADSGDVRRAREAPGLLRAFNDAGVLVAADVQVARRLARLGGEEDPAVVLAAALAVRAPRLGHVFADLAAVRATATVESDEPVDLEALPWPDPDDWLARVGASPLVDGPLRLEGSALYLDRYLREEAQVAADLLSLGAHGEERVDLDLLTEGLARMLPRGRDAAQRLAAASAVLRRFAVVAGGPGTGKTTTVAPIVALLAEQAAAAGAPAPLVALAAPTGKAAARLAEAVHEAAASLDVPAPVRESLLALEASTLHRLLGRRPDSHSRFRHHRGNRLPHDLVVIDETSMVGLSMMARLVEAVRPDARLVLVGDPGQLASIEAGAVLGDITGPAATGLRLRPAARRRLAGVTGVEPPGAAVEDGPAIGDGIIVLDHVHRYRGAIAELAAAVRAGDADGALAVLRDAGADGNVTWIAGDPAEPDASTALEPVRAAAVETARAVTEAAAAGRAAEALGELGAFRLLCAHRRGPHGVAAWTARVQGWLGAALDGFTPGARWYAGRPLLVTENDYGLRLFNGDTGVVVTEADGRLGAAFERHGEVVRVSPARLDAVETVYAMTVHKSQGSQFRTAAVLLPPPESPLLTRELLYTAVTRAREALVVAGTEAAVRGAVERPIARASGLRDRLWGGSPRRAATGP